MTRAENLPSAKLSPKRKITLLGKILKKDTGFLNCKIILGKRILTHNSELFFTCGKLLTVPKKYGIYPLLSVQFRVTMYPCTRITTSFFRSPSSGRHSLSLVLGQGSYYSIPRLYELYYLSPSYQRDHLVFLVWLPFFTW